MANHINRVVMTANLTKDPDLHRFESGTCVCTLRVASNTRRKNNDGTWSEKPNYFDVKVWGRQGERAAEFLTKGRMVGIDGHLEWREFETQGQKRQVVEIIADALQFIGSGSAGDPGSAPIAPEGEYPAH